MKAQNRDWRTFWVKAFQGLKPTIASCLFVPVFFAIVNPEYNEPGWVSELLFSCRIGLQISIFCWCSFTLLYAIIFYFNPETLYSLKRSPLAQILFGFAMMVIALSLTSLAEPHISGRDFGLRSVSLGALIGGITLVGIILFQAYREMSSHFFKLRAESAETNLNVLKNQMQPHFLFNSLNSLAELIHSDGKQAAEMTHRLADLYREILENSKTNLASAKSEFNIIRKYLELEKVRFGDRLSYNLVEPENSEGIHMPSLVLQTLVENALKHGLAPALEGGQVDVAVKPLAAGYQVEIANSGAPLAEKPKSSRRGTGLDNTRSRLDLLYGERSSFAIAHNDGRTHVSFWISGEPS